MTQSFQLGTLANMITANGSTNVVTVSNSLIITGEATVSGNLNINSTSDIVFNAAAGISANGSLGTAGQALTTNGTAVYWATVAAGTNVAAQYTWTNTNIFQANVTVNSFFAQTKISIGTAAGYDHGALAVLEIDASQNTYVQSVIQNANSGTNASGDLIITNDIGNDSVNYVNFGINSSTYNNTFYTVVGANDAYLYASNGALGIGTASAKDVIFHANGTLTTNEVMRMGANTRITVANTLVVNGNLLFNSGYGSAATAYGCRAWVNFNGTGTVAIRGSGNVTSITDNGNGDYTVNFTTSITYVNYAVTGMSRSTSSSGYLIYGNATSGNATGSVRISTSSTTAFGDSETISISIFR
jgi:hypothetical protein